VVEGDEVYLLEAPPLNGTSLSTVATIPIMLKNNACPSAFLTPAASFKTETEIEA
jgi:hypothetical protein